MPSTEHLAKDDKKPFWAKCQACGHCWAVAYYPMAATTFAKIAMQAKLCPKCGAPKPVIAKQDNGILQEATT